MAPTKINDPAAIIFTTGSTGPPKGVLYTHGNFDAQVEEIRDFYSIRPGEIDLPGFPLFGLFNCAMGTTTVIPDMDPSRPARVDPEKFVEAIHDWKVTQTFGSPAIFNRVGRYCEEHQIQIPTVRRVLSGRRTGAGRCAPEDEGLHRSSGRRAYSLRGDRVVAGGFDRGHGSFAGDCRSHQPGGPEFCVGRKFPQIEWKVIRIVDGPIECLDETEPLEVDQIGELIVRGPVVTPEYVTRVEANALGKIPDGTSVWHRLGDVGYFDSQERFWFCGRLAHRVLTTEGPMYTVCCEAVFNQHPAIFRSALVGVGTPGRQLPVIILEPLEGRMPEVKQDRDELLAEMSQLAISNPLTERIEHFLLHPAVPPLTFATTPRYSERNWPSGPQRN